LFPIEETMPMPVTTTRLIQLILSAPYSGSLAASFLSGSGGSEHENPSRSRTERGCRLCGFEQANAQISRRIDHLAVGFHHSVGDRQFQLAEDDTLHIHHVFNAANGRKYHSGEFNLSDAERTTAPWCTQPAQEEAG